ncbi:MAG: DUF1080 domain-containing protein [Verrucomicrobiota bacterium JB023]|nr:DUF1080 domain-containing protein [Verrucomicrobiota bacterium JB023]
MAQEKKKLYPDAPQIPGWPYSVHDTTRPQPRKVESGGAVSVSAPSDAKVLFDGSNLDAWKGPWLIKEGILVAHKGKLSTKEEFGDCQLHIEWRIPAEREVSGQKGGNSGVFFMGRYEVQVLESHSNETYPDGQAGAIYGQYPPLCNASAPQGDWQSYDIIFKAPRYKDGKCIQPAQVTVIHNGVVVQAAQNYMGPSAHQKLASYPKEHPEKAPLSLQFHGDPIEFRNIWIRDLGKYDQQSS